MRPRPAGSPRRHCPARRCSGSGAACRRWSWRTCSTTAARPTTRSCSAPWRCGRRTSTSRRRCWRTASWRGGPVRRKARPKVGPVPGPRPLVALSPSHPGLAAGSVGPLREQMQTGSTGLRRPSVPSGPAPVRGHPRAARALLPARSSELDLFPRRPRPQQMGPQITVLVDMLGRGGLPFRTSASVGARIRLRYAGPPFTPLPICEPTFSLWETFVPFLRKPQEVSPQQECLPVPGLSPDENPRASLPGLSHSPPSLNMPLLVFAQAQAPQSFPVPLTSS